MGEASYRPLFSDHFACPGLDDQKSLENQKPDIMEITIFIRYGRCFVNFKEEEPLP